MQCHNPGAEAPIDFGDDQVGHWFQAQVCSSRWSQEKRNSNETRPGQVQGILS